MGAMATLGRMWWDCGTFPWTENATAIPCSTCPMLLITASCTPALRRRGLHRPLPQRLPAHHGAVLSPMNAFCFSKASRRSPCASTGTWRMHAKWRISARRSARRVGELRGFADNPYFPCAEVLGGRACSLMTFEIRGGLAAGMRFYDALKLFKRLVNFGDAKSLAAIRPRHPPADVAGGTTGRGRRPRGIRLSVGIEHIDGHPRRSGPSTAARPR